MSAAKLADLAPAKHAELAPVLAGINADREAAIARVAKMNASGATAAGVDRFLQDSADIDERLAAVKAAHFGTARYRRHRLIVASGAAYLASPTGRSVIELWRGEE